MKNRYRRSEVDRTMTQKKGSGKRQFCTLVGARSKTGGPDVRSRRFMLSFGGRVPLRRRYDVLGRDKLHLISQIVEEGAVRPEIFLRLPVKEQDSLQVRSHDCEAATS